MWIAEFGMRNLIYYKVRRWGGGVMGRRKQLTKSSYTNTEAQRTFLRQITQPLAGRHSVKSITHDTYRKAHSAKNINQFLTFQRQVLVIN